MKNTAIYYHGGCGGHFLYFFLLASGRYSAYYKTTGMAFRKINTIQKIKKHFYLQFQKDKPWLIYEIWPDNTPHNCVDQLFLFCHPTETELTIDNIKICPYINEYKTWFRTVLFKKTNIFRDKKITLSFVKLKYKELLKKFGNEFFNTKIKGCDYYIEITKFVNDIKQRRRLCDTLSIPHTSLMEEFVLHYNECHTTLKKKTSW